MFYTTDISVTLWVLNKDKNEKIINIGDETHCYRDREKEVLFVDLRRWGTEYEKMYTELTLEDIQKIARNFHNWRTINYKDTYKNIPEYCYSASFEEIKENDFSLVPSKYLEFIDRDSEIDFDTEMKRIRQDFKILLKEEKESQEQLVNAFKVLGYEL
jgi:type I restriction enzyme M protein